MAISTGRLSPQKLEPLCHCGLDALTFVCLGIGMPYTIALAQPPRKKRKLHSDAEDMIELIQVLGLLPMITKTNDFAASSICA